MQIIKNSGTQDDWNAESVFSFLREKRILVDEGYNRAVPESAPPAPSAVVPVAEVKKTEVKEKEPAPPVPA